MQPNKDIVVTLNGDACLTISKDNRVVKADDIYRLLNYSKGDSYSIISENENNLDAPVVQFFEELLKEITERINRLNESFATGLEEVQLGANDSHDETEELPF